jgi:NAD(P)-dependent dehydrogenase (short-subunit alcohol dehydrogenase family)
VHSGFDYWDKFLKVNVTSVLLTTQAVIPAMTAQGKGKIINQSSTAGALSANVYGLTKLAVQGLTVAFARELAPFGINVNCIGPGVTNTPATLDHYPDGKMDEFVDKLHLIKRAPTPDDHGAALIYLASDESDMMTGQILRTDGGAFLLPV